MQRWVIGVVVLAIGLVPGLAFAAGSAATKTFTLKLSGAAEVPKASPTSTGTAVITITSPKVCWAFTYKGIDKPLAAHIHKGATGKAGPVVVPFGRVFKAKGCTQATAAVANAILAHPARYYVNIHTKKYPAGALRAQLAKAAASSGGGGGGGYGGGGYG